MKTSPLGASYYIHGSTNLSSVGEFLLADEASFDSTGTLPAGGHMATRTEHCVPSLTGAHHALKQVLLILHTTTATETLSTTTTQNTKAWFTIQHNV